ncbi:unnamed protein product [Ilex paraguariensis]|uniref:DUF7755 domain-containing protein n=1 Tax=Ilex paraguariensis TaxID=185542 RepID=A0ABC8V0U4_9AQUA
MESLSVKHLIATAHYTFPIRYPVKPIHTSRVYTQIWHFRFVLYSKRSDFQDFQGYAKPSRLLPPTDVRVCPDSSLEKVVASFKCTGSETLYKVMFKTSSTYGSGLSDTKAGVQLCLIDENGDSILQRIPAISMKENIVSDDKALSEVLHFQRGSVDDFTFEGPKLGKIEALWVSLESGQWRLGDVSLTVISKCQPLSDENDKKGVQCICCQYDFEIEDMLLGEKSDISMAELRPSQVSEFSGDSFALLGRKTSQPGSFRSYNISNEESMKEYVALKFSLLFYDAILILSGLLIASLLAGDNAALAFLTGGVGGFLYLLLLQRSVDGLPAAESISKNGTGIFDQIFGVFKSRLSGLVVLFAFAAISVKYYGGDNAKMLAPKEIMFGMMGFLMCKVSAVLAAFKPMPMGLKDNK